MVGVWGGCGRKAEQWDCRAYDEGEVDDLGGRMPQGKGRLAGKVGTGNWESS